MQPMFAVQRDVVQFPLRRLRFTRIFLRLVTHFASANPAGTARCRQRQPSRQMNRLLSDRQRVDFRSARGRAQENGCRAHKDFE